MKKIITLLIIIFSLYGATEVGAYIQRDFLIDWVCVNVDIPINANFADYEKKYIVDVYVDGRKLSDSEYFCALNQNGTSTSTINTSKVGTHRIGARVELLNYNASSETYITYKVVDDEAPEVVFTQDSISTLYGYEPNYMDYIIATDNSDNALSVEVKGAIDYKKIGTYNIILAVSDGTNVKEVYVDVHVIDTLKPYIQLIAPIVVSLGENITISDFLKATDGYDGDISNRIELDNFDSSKLGEQLLYASVYDVSGNEARMQVKVTIVDDVAPVIEFNTNDARIDINEDITFDKMKSFIRQVTDNYSFMDIDDIRIDFSGVYNELGSYTVDYYATDDVGNECLAKLTVRVVQMDGPIITCKDVVVGSGEVFQESLINNYITVYDPYDSTAASTLRVDLSGVNLGSPGTYFAVISACNSSGVFTYETLTITVEGSGLSGLFSSPGTVIALIGIFILFPVGGLCYFGYNKFQKDKLKKFE